MPHYQRLNMYLYECMTASCGVNMYLYWDPDTRRSYSTFTASVEYSVYIKQNIIKTRFCFLADKCNHV